MQSEDPESSLKPFDMLGNEGGSKGVYHLEEVSTLIDT